LDQADTKKPVMDMVTKSSNYCCTTSEATTGLMALSEVALGKQHPHPPSHPSISVAACWMTFWFLI